MTNPLLRKLENFERLSTLEKQALLSATNVIATVGARKVIVQEGDKPRGAHVIIKGFACRYKILADGGRQIMDFLIPGDLCDGHLFVLQAMDHSIGTLSACEIAHIDYKTLLTITQKHPRITRALWWATLIDEAILREWVANVGRRPADRRVAHLLSELFVRLRAVREAKTNGFDLPVSQIDLADATALSTVHINRILQKLREKRMLTVERKTIHVKDAAGLMEFAEFNPSYLHLGRNNGSR